MRFSCQELPRKSLLRDESGTCHYSGSNTLRITVHHAFSTVRPHAIRQRPDLVILCSIHRQVKPAFRFHAIGR